MTHVRLEYALADNYLQRRPQFRTAHLALAWQAADRGDLVLAGAIEEPAGAPVERALLLFRDAAAAASFARADPYVIEGLVTEWAVRRWVTVVGAEAATPVRA